jgi:hypothetical protein
MEIEEFLRVRGLDSEARIEAIRLAKDKMSSVDFNPDGDYSFGTSVPEKIEQKNKTTNIIKLSEEQNKKQEREFLESLGNVPKTGKASFVVHDTAPALGLIFNSFSLFFSRFYKYLILFALHAAPPLAVFFIGNITSNFLITIAATSIALFLTILFPISLAKFISNDDEGYIFAMKYALVFFIPIHVTLALVSTVIFTLMAISVGFGIFVASYNIVFGIIIGVFLLIMALIIGTWYSLSFFIMINEEVFYIDAVAKSRKYIKHKLTTYCLRIALFIVTYIVLIFICLTAISLTIYFTNNVSLEVFTYNFSLNSILLALMTLTNLASMIVSAIAVFFLLIWPTIFGYLLYHDFAMDRDYGDATLSLKHQNLFFIALVLGSATIPYLSNDKISKFSESEVNYNDSFNDHYNDNGSIFSPDDEVLEFNWDSSRDKLIDDGLK